MSRWTTQQHALLDALGVDWPSAPGQAPVEAIRAVDAALASAALAPLAAPVPAPPAAAPAVKPVASIVQGADFADLDALAAAVRSCQACGLCKTRRQAVPGIGHSQAEWMIVGEGPGEQEDEQGEPFVGRSGQLLDEMLATLGLSRAPGPRERQVFIANTVKCRPPGNRNPSAEELAACAPYLQRQLALVKPRVVLALGRFAAQSLLGSEAPVGSLRGKIHRLDDGTPVVVSYHPAYLLRQPLEKARAWDDLCLAASRLQPDGGGA